MTVFPVGAKWRALGASPLVSATCAESRSLLLAVKIQIITMGKG
jgi:hypothetical protein